MIKKTIKTIQKKGLTIAFAESMTAGGISYQFAKIKHASHHLKGSLVVYQSEQKTNLLNISQDDILKYGVVSPKIAYQMAAHCHEKISADIVLSITGNADPSYGDQTIAYIGIYYQGHVKVYDISLTEGTRIKNINQAIEKAYNILYTHIKKD